MRIEYYLIFVLLFVNVIAFVLFGIDKQWKRKGTGKRISEYFLLFWCFAGGALGASLGMNVFRHKNNRQRFFVMVPLLLLFQILVGGYFFFIRM